MINNILTYFIRSNVLIVCLFLCCKIFLAVGKKRQKASFYKVCSALSLLIIFPLDLTALIPDHAVTADIVQSVSVQKYIFTETQHIPVVKKIMPLLAAVWCIGVAFNSFVCIYKYFALKHFVDRWATDNGVYKCGNKSLKVKKCPGISSPMLMGMIAPVIILPDNIAADNYDVVCMHEKFHYLDHDIIIRAVMQVVCIINWFDPFAYKLSSSMNLLSEIACDEKVVKEMNYTEKYNYCGMLINRCENKQDTAFSACLYSQKENVKTRINEITAKKKKSYANIIILVAITLSTLILCSFVDINISENSSSAFTFNNGEMITKEPVHANAGQSIDIMIALDLSSDYSDKDGEYVELGYYQGGTEHRIFCDKTAGNEINFTADKDGDYTFYLKNYSAYKITLSEFDVNVQ